MRIPLTVLVFLGAAVAACSSNGDKDTSATLTDGTDPVALVDDAANFAQNLEKAKAGDAGARHNAAVAYLRGDGVEQAEIEAVTWFQLAAGQGNPDSQYSLGVLFEQGRGVKKDPAAAAGWYLAAAEQGHADAQINLGSLYLNENGITRDDERAAYWYGRAAAQGVADAQFLLGGMYGAGLGIERDPAAALEWFRHAAGRGHKAAALNLSLVALGNRNEEAGEETGSEAALKWYRVATGLDVATACYRIGKMFEQGKMVKPDPAQAVEWYRRALKQGHEEVEKDLDKLDADN